jgi:hypothetical protein
MLEKTKNLRSHGREIAEWINVSNETKANILDDFLDKYLEPAFGSLSKTEIDMLVLELLEQTGIIKEKDSQYSLSKKLKVSQAKAKNLLYNRTLRKCKEEDLDNMTKELLQKPAFQKDDCKWFLFHVEHPLLIEHIRDKIQRLGHISDGSFSPHIIRLSAEAFAALIEDYIPNKDEALKVLENLGMNVSLKSFLANVLKSSAKTLAEQFAGETGALIANKTFDYLPKLWQNNFKHLTTIGVKK